MRDRDSDTSGHSTTDNWLLAGVLLLFSTLCFTLAPLASNTALADEEPCPYCTCDCCFDECVCQP